MNRIWIHLWTCEYHDHTEQIFSGSDFTEAASKMAEESGAGEILHYDPLNVLDADAHMTYLESAYGDDFAVIRQIRNIKELADTLRQFFDSPHSALKEDEEEAISHYNECGLALPDLSDRELDACRRLFLSVCDKVYRLRDLSSFSLEQQAEYAVHQADTSQLPEDIVRILRTMTEVFEVTDSTIVLSVGGAYWRIAGFLPQIEETVSRAIELRFPSQYRRRRVALSLYTGFAAK